MRLQFIKKMNELLPHNNISLRGIHTRSTSSSLKLPLLHFLISAWVPPFFLVLLTSPAHDCSVKDDSWVHLSRDVKKVAGYVRGGPSGFSTKGLPSPARPRSLLASRVQGKVAPFRSSPILPGNSKHEAFQPRGFTSSDRNRRDVTAGLGFCGWPSSRPRASVLL